MLSLSARVFAAVGAFLAVMPNTALGDQADVDLGEVAVFRSGEDGYHTFRIPALLRAADGALLAFCEGRKSSRQDHGDIDLVVRRSEDGGRTWGPLQVVYEQGGDAPITIGNPCPVLDAESGAIWLPFCRDNRDVLVTQSSDGGRTWSAPVDITSQVKKPGWSWYATGPGVGIQVIQGKHKGRLVIPCDHREEIEGRGTKMSHAFYSDDHGRSWQLGASVAPHTDECQVAELADGSLLMNMRNYWGREGGKPEIGNRRAIARSTDGAATWEPLDFDLMLIEPVCQASLIRISKETDGASAGALVFANPASTTKRERMTVRLSTDDGKSWPWALVVHAGPAAYSSLAADGNDVLLLYEGGEENAYETIRFARINPRQLRGGNRSQ
jgi:sialidase-1